MTSDALPGTRSQASQEDVRGTNSCGLKDAADCENHLIDLLPAEVERALRILVEPGCVFELRALECRRGEGRPFTASGYFNDFALAAGLAVRYEQEHRPTGIYVTLNPVNPELLARSRNAFTDYPRATTKDLQITHRRWLLLDFDPVRESGISACQSEAEAAIKRSERVAEWLSTEFGWPEPVWAHSGNGAHLLYRIDLQNDENTTAIVKAILANISRQHSDKIISVDTAVGNAARICKLYGTIVRKGTDTLDRPHRRSKILSRPDQIEIVVLDALKKVAGLPQTKPPKKPLHQILSSPAKSDFRRLDVAAWLLDRGIGFTIKPQDAADGRTFYLLERCPFNEHKDDGGRHACITQDTSGKLGFHCFADRCQQYGWQDVKRIFGEPSPEHYTPPDPCQLRTGSSETNRFNNEHLTDLGNARRLVRRHGHDLRYASHLKKWLVWDGTRWECDDSGIVERLAKETVISIYAEAATASDENSRKTVAKWAQQSESEKRIQATINLAVSEPGIIVKSNQLDADDWLLNCTNGTLDLRTGGLQPHSREDLLTKIVPVAYDIRAMCPRWDSFLERVLKKSPELIGFVQRAVGYSLAGSTREHAMFILYGTGRNGKSTFLETIRALFGDYAQHTPTETLMVRRSGGIPNDLARLKGARLVTASETEAGQRLAESLIKQLTGGDTITARYLHREFFEFKPAFKFFLAANHKPVIRGTDHAIWERIRLIPFTVTIPEDEQDKELPAKLHAELPGILRWAVQGCRDWQNQGLGESVEVKTATANYRSEMDILGEFIGQCCIKRSNARVGVTEFYKNYREWCDKTGEKPLTQTAFNGRLIEQGFEKKKSDIMTWFGIGLLDSRHAVKD